jgi:hypothetical protein
MLNCFWHQAALRFLAFDIEIYVLQKLYNLTYDYVYIRNIVKFLCKKK